MSQVVSAFGIPIYCHELTGISEDVEKILEFCKDSSNFRTLTTSGNNLMSTDYQVLDTLDCKNLKSEILSQVRFYADEVMGIDYDDIVITQCWVNQYPPGASHHMHTHPNCLISANMWLKVSENCGYMTFEDPLINFNQIEPTVKKETPYNSKRMSIEPAENFMVVFPSNIHHTVEQNKSNETRISMAINFWIKGTLGKEEHYNMLKL
jgi:uncharacterized protein (TIGR02466 family)